NDRRVGVFVERDASGRVRRKYQAGAFGHATVAHLVLDLPRDINKFTVPPRLNTKLAHHSWSAARRLRLTPATASAQESSIQSSSKWSGTLRSSAPVPLLQVVPGRRTCDSRSVRTRRA